MTRLVTSCTGCFGNAGFGVDAIIDARRSGGVTPGRNVLYM